nr:type VII secretion target [Rhodococcus sp. (in: high G+C Gram-positive bacteria)]
MTEVSAVSAGILAYSATAASMSAHVAAAAAATTACGPVVLAPVFGLIGTEFLGAFTGAHAAHVGALGQLATTIGSIGVEATASAAGYDGTDISTAASLM